MAPALTIRNLGRHADGYWIAEVSTEPSEGFIGVHRKFGSWMHGHGAQMQEVLHGAAAELQREVHKLEKKERTQ